MQDRGGGMPFIRRQDGRRLTGHVGDRSMVYTRVLSKFVRSGLPLDHYAHLCHAAGAPEASTNRPLSALRPCQAIAVP